MPAAVTLAEFQILAAEFGIFTRAIAHLDLETPPGTRLPLADLFRSVDNDGEERPRALNLLAKIDLGIVQSWALDCAEQAWKDADRVLPLWDGGSGQRSRTGPWNVVRYADQVLRSLGRGEPVGGRDDWYSWSRHHVWYLELYHRSRAISSPYHALARAVAQTYLAHGGVIRAADDRIILPETAQAVEHYTVAWTPSAILAASEDAAGEARYAELIGREKLQTGQLKVAEVERERAKKDRADWCWSRMIAHLAGRARAPKSRGRH